MKNNLLTKQKKYTNIALIVLVVVSTLAFVLFAPVSPLKGDIRGAQSVDPVPAAGFWGAIGFYENAADNNVTYWLMLMFVVLALYKLIRDTFFPQWKGKDTIEFRRPAKKEAAPRLKARRR